MRAAAGVPPGSPVAAHTSRNRAMATIPTSLRLAPSELAVMRDTLARVSVIVCELEIGETSIAYQVAADLELDLGASLNLIEQARADIRHMHDHDDATTGELEEAA